MRLFRLQLVQSPPLFALAIFIVASAFFGVRWSPAGQMVTNDEPFWLGRSANFSRAISNGDLEKTYQMAHPGVTVMWAGAIAFWLHDPDYSSPDPGNSEWPFFIDDRLVSAGIDPLKILQEARLVKLIFETFLFALSIALIGTIGTRLVALVTGILISLDPFLAGFGPLLHVDSLFAISLFCATLAATWAFTNYKNNKPTLWRCLFAGVLAGFAVLTRMTGLVIAIPMFAIAVAGFLTCDNSWRHHIPVILKQASTWVTGLVITLFVAWPALWVAPLATLQDAFDWTIGAASGGHEHALFFNGEILNGDAGFWFYPITILWRTTPIVWLGIGLCVVCMISNANRQMAFRFLPALVLGAAIFLMMTLGAKKFDRYVLPVYPVISLIAALGFTCVICWLRERYENCSKLFAPVVLSIILLASGVSLGSSGTYHLNYYNGVMRRFNDPEDVIQVGWGEGGSEVIDFLQSESMRLNRPITVQTFSIPQESIPPPLKYFLYEDNQLDGDVLFQNDGLDSAEDWLRTDYYVFNIQQTQRGMVSDYSLFLTLEPVHTVTLNGVVIWEIYSLSLAPFPDSIILPMG